MTHGMVLNGRPAGLGEASSASASGVAPPHAFPPPGVPNRQGQGGQSQSQRVTYIRPGALRQMVGVPGRSNYPGLGVKRVHPGTAAHGGGGAPPRPPKLARGEGLPTGSARPPPSPASVVSGSGVKDSAAAAAAAAGRKRVPQGPEGRATTATRGESLSSPAVVRSPASYGPGRTGVTPRTPGGHRGNLLLLPGEVLQRILTFLPHSSVEAVREACRTLQGEADVAKETHFNFVTPAPSPSGSALLARRARRTQSNHGADPAAPAPSAAGASTSSSAAARGGRRASGLGAVPSATISPSYGALRTSRSPSAGRSGGGEWEMTPASSPFPGGGHAGLSPAGSVDSRQTYQRTNVFGGRIPLQAPGAPRREKTSRSMMLMHEGSTGSFDNRSFIPNFGGDDGPGVSDTQTSGVKQGPQSPGTPHGLPSLPQTATTPVGRVLAFPPSSPALSEE